MRALLFMGLLALPLIASAASLRTFKDLVDYLVGYMNILIGILVAATIVTFFYGTVRHLFNSSEADTTEMRKFLLMGVVVIFVMVSIWGILALLDNTLKGQSGIPGEGGSSADESLCVAFGECGE